MKRLLSLIVTLVVFAALPTAATAQFRVYPRAGLIQPSKYFYEYFKNFAGDGLTEWTHTAIGRAFMAGAGMELQLGESALVRAEFLRSYDAWVSISHSQETLRNLFDPPEIVVTWLDMPVVITVTSVQLILPTRLEVGPFKPYVLVGGGGKFYRFGETTEPNDVEATLPTNGFAWGGDVGAGFTVSVWGLRLDAQARDTWNRYWGKFQHDYLYSGSLNITLF